MALTRTNLTSAINDSALDLPVVSNAGATAGKAMRIDNEYMAVVELVGTTLVKVRSRGDRGTHAVPHNALASINFGTGEAGEWPDHPVAQSGQVAAPAADHTTLGASGAITIPIEDTRFVIRLGSAAALTLGAPSKALNGLTLVFTSATAFAHTLTATGLLKTGTATVNLSTFAAFAGASITLQAEDGLWNVVANVATVLT